LKKLFSLPYYDYLYFHYKTVYSLEKAFARFEDKAYWI